MYTFTSRITYFLSFILICAFSTYAKTDSLTANWHNIYNKKDLTPDDIEQLNQYSSTFFNQHQLTKSYLCLEKVLIYALEKKDTTLIIRTKINFGNMLNEVGSLDESVNYFKESLALCSLKQDSLREAICHLNLTTIYLKKDYFHLDSAKRHAYLGVNLSKKINHKQLIALSNDKLIAYHILSGQLEEATTLLSKNIKLKDSLNISIKDNHFQKACLLEKMNKINSKEYLHQLTLYLKKSEEEESLRDIKRAYLYLSDYYRIKNNKNKAYEYLSKVYNTKTEKDHKKTNYLDQDDKKDDHILIFSKIQQQKFNEIQAHILKNHQLELAIKRKNTKILLIILLFISIISLIVYFTLRKVRQQKKTIEYSKKLLENQHKEVKDSITYARRIQEAVLPTKETVLKSLSESFIYYRPKDIVSGDFYWIKAIEDKVYFAVADCTGHGVPGAIVSILCINSLNKSISIQETQSTNNILDKTREFVIQEFEKSETNIKDGMDISLIAWDKKTNSIQFSGANNSIWIIRINENGPELIELKADKQPIGNFNRTSPFTKQEFHLQKGDIVYLSSDGYPDQFGGEKNKKMKTTNFKKLLVANSHLSISDQQLAIHSFFENWKGENEQLDDICVVGIKF